MIIILVLDEGAGDGDLYNTTNTTNTGFYMIQNTTFEFAGQLYWHYLLALIIGINLDGGAGDSDLYNTTNTCFDMIQYTKIEFAGQLYWH